MLDVAPIDMIYSLGKDFISTFPDALVPPSLKARAIDFKIHWVSETGETTYSQLTSGLRIVPTVSGNVSQSNCRIALIFF